ncbi:MAG: DUF6282 family protein [Beutenbergiaceae bacterium]
MTEQLPDWAVGLTDLHVHASPSLLPRHGDDRETIAQARSMGFETLVLKSHEGSTVERALALGDGTLGGIVLNSPLGGANPDAVEVAARLGGRVVWMPTVSAPTHKLAAIHAELSVHAGFSLSQVEVFDESGALLPAWHEVLDIVAAHDLLLVSGHLSAQETVTLFTAAREHGVQRLLVNHPKMAFLGWHEQAAGHLRRLEARLELGILPDLLGDADHASMLLLNEYPHELLVFGADLGHADHPDLPAALPPWLRALEGRIGATAAAAIMGRQGRELVSS